MPEPVEPPEGASLQVYLDFLTSQGLTVWALLSPQQAARLQGLHDANDALRNSPRPRMSLTSR